MSADASMNLFSTASARELISICIPTYNRVEMLEVAIKSAFAQTYRPLEVLVSDDSDDARTKNVVETLVPPSDVSLRYLENKPALGQNANVNRLFDEASGSYLILLHDDDVLLPHAAATMIECWYVDPGLSIAFGKQQIISQDGTVSLALSQELNAAYSRTSSRAGKQISLLESALRQQIPNDGYMIRSDIARLIRYRDYESVGVFCDVDFTLRLALEGSHVTGYFVDDFLTQYRRSDLAISNDSRAKTVLQPKAGYALYEFVRGITVDSRTAAAKEWFLQRISDKVVKYFAYEHKRKAALNVFCSTAYPWHRRLSPKGLYHLLLIMRPEIDSMRRYD